jgi:flavin-dependent dehydrogenase
VGDAAGYLDPLTGEGLRLGFASAKAAVKAITDGKHEQYDQQWVKLTRRYWFSTSMILAVRKNRLFSKLVVPVLSRFPKLFDWTLAYMEK